MRNTVLTLLLALLLVGCGAGPTITTVSVGATPTAIEPGSTALLSATVSGTGGFSNAVSWSIVGGGGSLSAQTGATVTYTASGVASGTEVVVKATSTANNTKSGEATVKVLAKPNIVSFNSDALVLGGGGGDIKLSWNVTGADALSIDQGIGAVTGSEKALTINKTTTYTLTATNPVGSISATRVITVTALGTQDWKKQLGTAFDDKANGIATDSSGNVFMAGQTTGAFVVGSNSGLVDAFLVKFGPLGNQLWTKQLSSDVEDFGIDVATDSSGNAIVAGYTGGLVGAKNEGGFDAFAVKFDGAGNEVWRKQIGTTTLDFAFAVATDSSSNVFLAGNTTGAISGDNLGAADAFVVKLGPDGVEQWRKQLGTISTDVFSAIATDSNRNIVAVGLTTGDLDGSQKGNGDAIAVKYDPNGELLWKKQLGSDGLEVFNRVATDSVGNVYAVGTTTGVIGEKNFGGFDGFLVKYDSSGQVVFKKQLGTAESDFALGVATDSNGQVYVSGQSFGTVAGSNFGDSDAFIIKYDSSGGEQWKKQIGSSNFDTASDVSADINGNVFVTGSTAGDLFDTQKGVGDAFVVRFK